MDWSPNTSRATVSSRHSISWNKRRYSSSAAKAHNGSSKGICKTCRRLTTAPLGGADVVFDDDDDDDDDRNVVVGNINLARIPKTFGAKGEAVG